MSITRWINIVLDLLHCLARHSMGQQFSFTTVLYRIYPTGAVNQVQGEVWPLLHSWKLEPFLRNGSEYHSVLYYVLLWKARGKPVPCINKYDCMSVARRVAPAPIRADTSSGIYAKPMRKFSEWQIVDRTDISLLSCITAFGHAI